jgi:hypothetical protein
MAPEPDDFTRLRAHVDAAYETADRLVREATERAEGTGAGAIPPRGWDIPREAAGPPRTDAFGVPELKTLLGVVEAVRAAVPVELAQQLLAAVRDLLLAVRALIDWWLDRLERQAQGPEPVQDIPIE